MNRAQLDLFRERLPRKPYHTDEFTTGLSIADVSRALGARYIQPNGPTHRHWLVFDVDHAAATLSWDDVGAPAPNITVTNRANGHAHLIYGLETPIRTAPDGKVAPLRYAAAIEAALREKLGADLGYSGLICKNPLHTHWLVQVWEPASYDLSWLADYLDLSPYNGRKQLPAYGLGRNCTLFEKTRQWAYKAIRQGWPGYEAWLSAVIDRAIGYNVQFEQPLPANEVRHTAKSIAKWTHRNLTPAGFSAVQTARGAKGGRLSKGGGRPSNSGKALADLLPEVLRLKAQGYSNRDIAEDLQISAGSVSNYLRRDRE
ncbi:MULTISPECIES: replication initiation protein [Aeromonas]|uniref:replication initiation protein n=1 Tax=Aeromonas TaxID=642 RepID=UPI001CC650DD|nr:replication initiation protein [Aeromonas caviae]MDX7644829.1 replication initiation protein [Aeromonas caviae]